MEFNIKNIFNKQEAVISPEQQKFFDELNGLETVSDPDQLIEKVDAIRLKFSNADELIQQHSDRDTRDIFKNVIEFIRNHKDSSPALYNVLKKSRNPEYILSSKKADRRLYRTIFAVFAALSVSIGAGLLKTNIDMDNKSSDYEQWKKLKSELSVDDIKIQADTIFQGLQGNINLYSAYTDMSEKIEEDFDKQEDLNFEVHKDQVYEAFDEFDSTHAGLGDELVVEYWKHKQKLPNDYYGVAYKEGGAGFNFSDIKRDYRVCQREIETREDDLQRRIDIAYNNAGGTISWAQAVQEAEKKYVVEPQQIQNTNKDETEQVRDLDREKFERHIDSLMAPDMVQYLEIGREELHQIKSIKKSIAVEEQRLSEIIKKRKDELEGQKYLTLSQGVKVYSAQVDALLEKYQDTLNPEMKEYFKLNFLENEVFDNYSFEDELGKKQLDTLEQSSEVQELIQVAQEARIQYDLGDKSVKNKYDQMISNVKDLVLENKGAELENMKGELNILNTSYHAKKDKSYDALMDKYNQIWNSECERMGVAVEAK